MIEKKFLTNTIDQKLPLYIIENFRFSDELRKKNLLITSHVEGDKLKKLNYLEIQSYKEMSDIKFVPKGSEVCLKSMGNINNKYQFSNKSSKGV